jgi:hypothetical protein
VLTKRRQSSLALFGVCALPVVNNASVSKIGNNILFSSKHFFFQVDGFLHLPLKHRRNGGNDA